jgi:hypothetical protein
MVIRNLKTLASGGQGKINKSDDEHLHSGHDETCRCKETSAMKPGDLFRLMMSDLAFWKKTKKG